MENMNNQKKGSDQYGNIAKLAWYVVEGMITLLVILTLLGGCSTTKKADSCCSSKTVVE